MRHKMGKRPAFNFCKQRFTSIQSYELLDHENLMLCTNICVVNKLARKVENDKLCGKNPQHENN